MIFAITVAPTACKYFVCSHRECPACVRLGNAKASFHATLGLRCHPRHRAGISFLSSSTEGRGSSAYSGLIVDIIRLGLSKKDNLFFLDKIVFMLYMKFKTSL